MASIGGRAMASIAPTLYACLNNCGKIECGIMLDNVLASQKKDEGAILECMKILWPM
jgi:hypothetical protein